MKCSLNASITRLTVSLRDVSYYMAIRFWRTGCSDGLYDMVHSSHMKGILQEPIPADERVEKLIDAALEAGGKDNVTVIVIDLMK